MANTYEDYDKLIKELAAFKRRRDPGAHDHPGWRNVNVMLDALQLELLAEQSFLEKHGESGSRPRGSRIDNVRREIGDILRDYNELNRRDVDAEVLSKYRKLERE
ncbi:MAG TPA: hypothetical protein VNL14_14015 [Candidatus Acidoferrales bacterium]|nr:hypothetical protein [Candidatus Acidoferrales bacterium]